MRATDRVKIIQRIASSLQNADFSEAEFVLDAFGAPKFEERGFGNLAEYIRVRLRSASEAQLLEIAEHQGLQLLPTDESLERATDVWEAGKLRLFMSHTSTHKQMVAQAKGDLRKWGITSFVAHEDIEPTKDWLRVIELALSTCDALCALITPDFASSKWTDQEVGWAYGRGVPVFAIRVGADPYGFIGKFQGLPGGPGSPARLGSDVILKLVDRLSDDPRTSSAVALGVVTAFCESSTFAAVRERYPLIARIKYWSPEMMAAIDEALVSNRQIRFASISARDAVEVVEELLKPYR